MLNQEAWGRAMEQTAELIGAYLPNIFAALVILVVGWFGAWLVATLVRVGLNKLGLNKRMHAWCHAETPEATPPQVERTVSRVVFGLLMLFVVVAFFETLRLTLVTEPLNQFLYQIFDYAPRVVGAGALLLLAWVVARVLRFVVGQVLHRTQIDERLSRQAGVEGENRVPLAKTVGEAVYWLTFLLFLPIILNTLAMRGLLGPVQDMLTTILGYLPNVFAAAVVLVIGWFVARIVQRLVTNVLAAIGTDRLSEKVGVSAALGKNNLSGLVGLIVYILILIPVLIASLNALNISAVTQPASEMLSTILGALPSIFAAFLVVAIAYVVGRIVAGLVTSLLESVGFNRVWSHLGVQRSSVPTGKTPSQIVGYLVLVGVILLAVMQAMQMLHFNAVTELMAQFLVFAGQVIVGLIVFGLGIYIAKVVANTIRATDMGQAHILAPVAQISIWVLAGAMALRQMGLATDIVNMAFGLVFGAV
ncbi:MAG: mechanosensitive ion channel, partial [Pirellulaceae bacterium]|nr:mechanosensitive ion channel [Pirellulaceae bacterium]